MGVGVKIGASVLPRDPETGLLDFSECSLNLSAIEAATLRASSREQRSQDLQELAYALVDYAVRVHAPQHEVRGIAVGFSGGNDSTILTDLMARNRRVADIAFHANTTIGIQQTREFVRSTCQAWDLPLVEKTPDLKDSYRSLVLAHGFPGPAQHFKMYQRLKERCIRKLRDDYITQSRQQRLVLLAGRRRTESKRRAMVPEAERQGSVVWASPLILWTPSDMNTYRILRGDIPRNEVSDLIHMSGECLCGSFAEKGELEEIGAWFPENRAEIEALEAEIVDREDIPEIRRRWGWGAYRDDRAALMARAKSGGFCTSCDARANGGTIVASA